MIGRLLRALPRVLLAGASVCLLFITAPAYALGMDDVPRITPEELKTRIDKGEKIVILDARSVISYARSKVRIKGDVRMAPHEISERAKELPLGREIVAYCT